MSGLAPSGRRTTWYEEVERFDIGRERERERGGGGGVVVGWEKRKEKKNIFVFRLFSSTSAYPLSFFFFLTFFQNKNPLFEIQKNPPSLSVLGLHARRPRRAVARRQRPRRGLPAPRRDALGGRPDPPQAARGQRFRRERHLLRSEAHDPGPAAVRRRSGVRRRVRGDDDQGGR